MFQSNSLIFLIWLQLLANRCFYDHFRLSSHYAASISVQFVAFRVSTISCVNRLISLLQFEWVPEISSNMERQDEEIARKHEINEMESNKKSISETNEGTREESGMEFSGSEGWMDCSGSEEMKFGISGILERVERFNQLVFEMLESGKAVLNKLNGEFEERVLMIHREKIEKWQEGIKELRMIDTTNEEMNARVDNVKCLLQTVHFNQ